MKPLKAKPRPTIILLFLLLNLVWCNLPAYAQGFEEDPLTAFKWYYCPRAYPFDTIPGGAFKNAVDQRKTLLQSTGYQFPGTGWVEIGPKPFGYDIGSSGRIHNVLYDPHDRDEDGSGRVIYVTGESGGLWKTRLPRLKSAHTANRHLRET